MKAVKNSMKKIIKYVIGKLLDTSQEEISSMLFWASLVAQMVKNLPAMWATLVQPLGWEDPLQEEVATHSSILAWKITWTEEPGRLQSMGSRRVRHE